MISEKVRFTAKQGDRILPGFQEGEVEIPDNFANPKTTYDEEMALDYIIAAIEIKYNCEVITITPTIFKPEPVHCVKCEAQINGETNQRCDKCGSYKKQ